MDSFVQKDTSHAFPSANPMMIERGLQWKELFETDEEMRTHMLSTLSHINNLENLIDWVTKHGVWDTRGFRLRVLRSAEEGGYCKGPTQVKTYASFCLMTDSELVEIMMFLETQIDTVKKPRKSSFRALETLRAIMEFRKLDTQYILWLLKRTKEKFDALYQDFVLWTRQHEKNTFPGEFRASSSNVVVAPIINTVERETARLLALAKSIEIDQELSDEWEISEIDDHLDGIKSDLSEFIQGNLNQGITPYKIALNRIDQDKTQQAIMYFMKLVRLILVSSDSKSGLSEYREQIRKLCSSDSLSSKQQILHDFMIAILDSEETEMIRELIKPEQNPIVTEVPQEVTMVPEDTIIPENIIVQENNIVQEVLSLPSADVSENTELEQEPVLIAFLKKSQEIIHARNELLPMVRKILDDLEENEISEEEQDKILSQIRTVLQEIFSNRPEEVIQLLQSIIRSRTKKPIRPDIFTMQNSEEERERRLSEIAWRRHKMKAGEFIKEHAHSSFFVGKERMSFVDILTKIAPSRSFTKDYETLVGELNITLRWRWLPVIPTKLQGLRIALNGKEWPSLGKKDLLERFKITVPVELSIEKPSTPEPLPVAKKTEVAIEKKENIGKKRISIEGRQELFVQATDMPFDTQWTTLRKILEEVSDMKKGFWDKIFHAIWQINPILIEQWNHKIPGTITGLSFFLTGEMTTSREKFLALLPTLWIVIQKVK